MCAMNSKLTSSLFVLYFLASTCTLVAQGQNPVVTICFIPIIEDLPMNLHGVHAMTYYAEKYNQVEWKWKFVGNPVTTAKNTVLAWAKIAENGGCDVLVGPGYSNLAVAMSPLVTIPWVDGSATSTELSDKESHPFFSRVVPTDETGAKSVAALMHKMGWYRTNVLCVEEPYGRSVATGLSQAMTDAGGIVEVSRCLEQSASPERVQTALDAFVESKTRLLFFAGLPSSTMYRNFVQQVLKNRLNEKLIIFFSEAFCSAGDRSYTNILGSFCATYVAKDAVMLPFLSSYEARDTNSVALALTELGYPSRLPLKGVTDVYSALFHDATHHTMSALHSRHVTKSNLSAIEFIRYHSSIGATGEVRLDKVGDRTGAIMAGFNVQPGTEKVFSSVLEDRTVIWQTDGGSTPRIDSLYYFDGYKSDPPSASAEEEEEKGSQLSNSMIVVIVVASILGCTTGFFVLYVTIRKTSTRDNRFAPQKGEFVVVFTDIQASTALWAKEPQIMSSAVDEHHIEMRRLVASHRGYEVKTVGDSFMVVFMDCEDAARFALDVQNHFFDLGSNPLIDDFYQEALKVNMTNADYRRMWNGLRIRVGLHYGAPKVVFDSVSQGYDYYGSVVNTAARVEAAGHGGMILITEEVLGRIGNSVSQCVISELNEQNLRGLERPIRLIQLVPKRFSKRTFPPLRLHINFELDNERERQEETDVVSLRSVSQYSTTTSNMFMNCEALMQRYARRWISEGHSEVTIEQATQQMSEYFHFLRSLYSTTSSQYRHKSLVYLSERWHLGSGYIKDRRNDAQLIMGLCYKTLKAREVQLKMSRETNGGSSSHLHGVTHQGSSSIFSLSDQHRGGREKTSMEMTSRSPHDDNPLIVDVY